MPPFPCRATTGLNIVHGLRPLGEEALALEEALARPGAQALPPALVSLAPRWRGVSDGRGSVAASLATVSARDNARFFASVFSSVGFALRPRTRWWGVVMLLVLALLP